MHATETNAAVTLMHCNRNKRSRHANASATGALLTAGALRGIIEQ